MICPKCGLDMREQDRSGILVDVCPGCRGVWLDRGELDKIIAEENRSDDDDDENDDDDDELELETAGGGAPPRRRRGRNRRGGFFSNLPDTFGGD